MVRGSIVCRHASYLSVLYVMVLCWQTASCENVNKQYCELSACDILEILSADSKSEDVAQKLPTSSKCSSLEPVDGVGNLRWRQLERRMRAMEQTVWTISRHRDRWRHCKSDSCTCEHDERKYTCWRSGLSSLTSDLVVPYDVSIIDLGTNKIATIHKNTFKGMVMLQELDMFDNNIDFIPNGVFDSLRNLRILRLHRNFIEELNQEIFRSAKKLVTLDISNNLLYSLPEKVFENNKYLETIDASNNKMVYLPSDGFHGIEYIKMIDLSKNKLSTVARGTFSQLKRLEELKLSNNKIELIEEGVFEDLESLKLLLLTNNNINNLPSRIFDNVLNLLQLDISFNKISHFLGTEFLKLRMLTTLNLARNEISNIPDNLFENCVSLLQLDMTQNRLRFLNLTAFERLVNLNSLLLTDNLIHEVHYKIFSTLKNLSTLSHSGDIVFEFSAGTSLLPGNTRIGTYSYSNLSTYQVFGKMPDVNIVILIMGCDLREHLDNNLFPSMPPRTLDFMPKLSEVKLAGNPWHCDCHALYISVWIRLNEMKLWDYSPMCSSPWTVEGRYLKDLTFPDLCTGQWASMVNLSPRLPIQQLMALNITVNRKHVESKVNVD